MPALEIARFTARPDEEEALVIERPAMLEALQSECSGLVSAHLAKLDDRTWIDVIVWRTREEALAAQEKAFAIPPVAAWFGHIDEVLAMEHADVAHAA